VNLALAFLCHPLLDQIEMPFVEYLIPSGCDEAVSVFSQPTIEPVRRLVQRAGDFLDGERRLDHFGGSGSGIQ
jgi:hypothetical protein